MQELFILIHEKHIQAICDNWVISQPHDGTFASIRDAVNIINDACPTHPVLERISFHQENFD